MKYFSLLLLLLVVACGNPTSQSESLEWKDSVSAANTYEPTTSEGTSTPETTGAEEVADDLEYESENMVNNAWEGFTSYAGEYTLVGGSEAEDGSSLTLTHVDRFIFNISITKMVADFCSGTISGEINLDHFPTATFDGDGHPVTITLKDGKIEVQDPERQLGVGTCEYNGTFVNINAD